MQYFNVASRLERLRRRAVQRGAFVDVTDQARQLGFIESVCIAKCVWECLIEPYPFSQQSDRVLLPGLLSLIKSHLRVVKGTNRTIFLLPSQSPEWCRTALPLKITVFSPPGQPPSILVQHLSDSFPSRVEHHDVLLPTTLLVRLAETLRNFAPVARTAEHAPLRDMKTSVDGLIRSNPFHSQIEAYLASFVLTPLEGAPPDNWRSVLLADLDELLAIAARCASVEVRPKVELLRSHYRALVSPLAHFCRMLEDLLRFTQSASNPHAPFQGQVFSLLLQLFVDITARLQRLETQVPADALSVVRFQLRLLSEAIGIPDPPFLLQIEQAFISLSKNRLPHPVHGPLHECRVDVVWH